MAYYGRNAGNEYSMSYNAKCAYERGEAPISKWSKAKILEAIEGAMRVILDARYEEKTVMETKELAKEEIERVKKMRKADLDITLTYCGWHHTGKFANQTEFYGIDVSEVNKNLISKKHAISHDEAENLQEEYEYSYGCDLW